MAVSFDLFGTLVTVVMPDNPAMAVAEELEAREVDVPDDFGDAYCEIHIDAPVEAEVSLPAHVTATLSSRGVDASTEAVREAVIAAFDPNVTRRDGARAAIEAASEHGPVGLCSNCSVPGLVERTLIRANLCGRFETVVTSVGCGWRKPNSQIFETVADGLGVETDELVHVGDDPATDGGIEATGGRFVDVSERPLSALKAHLESSQ